MKASIESIGKVGSRAVVDGHELVFDHPATVPGGVDRGPSPLDVMSVSVAACAHCSRSPEFLPGVAEFFRPSPRPTAAVRPSEWCPPNRGRIKLLETH